jgi:hypothetical protein
MAKCACCEQPLLAEEIKFCSQCMKQLTYYERLQIMKLADIGFCLFEMNEKMKNQQGWR